MTGFGSPCGACKFLRRKCVRGCVFAPYFSNEQGAAHFGAIHRVFGASNASKLLMQLPVSDRAEAAASISYEAQARIQDPVYGCVAHIFGLQQQVISLQAQVTSLKAQAMQRQMNNSGTSSLPTTQDTKFQNHDNNSFMNFQTPFVHTNNNFTNFQTNYYEQQTSPDSNNSGIFEDDSSNNSIDVETSAWGAGFNDSEDLQSVAYAYMRGTLDL